MAKHNLGEERNDDARVPLVLSCTNDEAQSGRGARRGSEGASSTNRVLMTKHNLAEEREEDPREPLVLIVY